MESSQVGEKANLPFKEVMYDGYVKLINKYWLYIIAS